MNVSLIYVDKNRKENILKVISIFLKIKKPTF